MPEMQGQVCALLLNLYKDRAWGFELEEWEEDIVAESGESAEGVCELCESERAADCADVEFSEAALDFVLEYRVLLQVDEASIFHVRSLLPAGVYPVEDPQHWLLLLLPTYQEI